MFNIKFRAMAMPKDNWDCAIIQNVNSANAATN